MTTVGYATLDVIPSMKGLRQQLDRQSSSDFAAAGKAGGRKFGDSAATEATTSFGKIRGKFLDIAKGAAAPLAGVFAGVGAFNFLKDSFAEAREAATVGRQTAAVLTATGMAAKVSAGQVSELAASLSAKVGVDDEAIQSGENLLLTFRNIKNEAGTGNNVFDQATEAILNVSTAMNQDLKASAVQVGKALNDPIKGMAALSRVGVTFTDQQKRQAKALIANGDILGAQKIILAELSKEFGGAAVAGHDAVDKMGVAFGNLEESVGTALMPALTAFANVTTNDVIPAVSAVGGAVGTAARAFSDLPTPVKAAATALVAFRLAAATGIGTGLASLATGGLAGLRGGLDDVRLRSMLVTDEFKKLRNGTLEINGQVGKFTPGVGRMSASLGALSEASSGAGRSLKAGLGSAVGLLGGPWGLAIAGGTIAVTHFWQQHQKAKQFVDDLTASLNVQTGRITANTKELIFNALEQGGAVKAAKDLGIALSDLLGAAEGKAEPLERVSAAIDDIAQGRGFAGAGGDPLGLSKLFGSDQQDAANAIRDSLAEAGIALTEAKGRQQDFAAATGKSADATAGESNALQTLAQRIKDAKSALDKLSAAEEKRRLSIIQNRRDEIALRETLRSAREEAQKGKRVLEDGSKAADANMSALLDLAEQWNQSTPKVQNARGAYKDLRKQFIDLADQMNGPGGTRDAAVKLADQLLKVPKTAPVKFQTEGFSDAMAQIKQLQAVRDFTINVTMRVNKVGAAVGGLLSQFANGGKVGGSGTGDTRLILADPREWVINPEASAYYGDDFMRRLNAKQITRPEAQRVISSGDSPMGGSGGGGHRVDVQLHVTSDAGQQVQLVRAVIRDDQAVTRNNVRMNGRGTRG